MNMTTFGEFNIRLFTNFTEYQICWLIWGSQKYRALLSHLYIIRYMSLCMHYIIMKLYEPNGVSIMGRLVICSRACLDKVNIKASYYWTLWGKFVSVRCVYFNQWASNTESISVLQCHHDSPSRIVTSGIMETQHLLEKTIVAPTLSIFDYLIYAKNQLGGDEDL